MDFDRLLQDAHAQGCVVLRSQRGRAIVWQLVPDPTKRKPEGQETLGLSSDLPRGERSADDRHLGKGINSP